jgi:hypothetical protein
MINFCLRDYSVVVSFDKNRFQKTFKFLQKQETFLIVVLLSIVSGVCFSAFHASGLAIAYNDARSHLNIGRRVVEGIQPGLAQLGSVWLPLPHALMIPTIWQDFMWHSGLSGAIFSMVAFVLTGVLINRFLKIIQVGGWGRMVGLLAYAGNTNLLYLQSTAMTELLLLFTMTAGVYEFVLWYKNEQLLNLLKASLWIMLASLVRYDAWFLFVFSLFIIIVRFIKGDRKALEGKIILFATLGGFGVVLWLFWNLLIFKDPLYFIFGPFSAHAQQKLLEGAGELPTKGKLLLSVKYYLYALFYNQGFLSAFFGFWGMILVLRERKLGVLRLGLLTLTAPFFFNVLALFLGHSVLFIQGLSGETWFNVRYGIMMAPSIAVFIGFLIDRLKKIRAVVFGLLFMTVLFSFISKDAVTIDDALHGASQKNVSEVSSWLKENARDNRDYILISAASHDAIIFSSGLPMGRFIHEGTGEYWRRATKNPAELARYIIMRTYDETDLTFQAMKQAPEFSRYRLVANYPFADVYELAP